MRAYLFDFDGTLVDSMPTWETKMTRILHEEGVDYPPDLITTIATLGDLGSAQYFQKEFGVTLTVDEMFEKMDAYALPKYRDEILLKTGVFERLNEWKTRGISLNVLTASPHKMLDPCLKRNRVWELFDHVWSCDDFGTTKSDPAIYRAAAERLGATVSDVVFFDDNFNAIATAKAAGMRTVAVYDKSAEVYTNLLKKTADDYLRSFEDEVNI